MSQCLNFCIPYYLYLTQNVFQKKLLSTWTNPVSQISIFSTWSTLCPKQINLVPEAPCVQNKSD